MLDPFERRARELEALRLRYAKDQGKVPPGLQRAISAFFRCLRQEDFARVLVVQMSTAPFRGDMKVELKRLSGKFNLVV